MNKTGIEYLDYTWNPLAMRCTPVSAGCRNCWHLAMADRIAANPSIIDDIRAAYAGDIPPQLIGYRLNDPLKKKEPSVIGVQFMGDLFHDSVLLNDIVSVFNVIAQTPQHTYVILTKRPERMHQFMSWYQKSGWRISISLLNVFLGTSISTQKDADEYIPWLLRIPDPISRVVSFEPALGPVDLTRVDVFTNALAGKKTAFGHCLDKTGKIDLVICGGESGSGARPLDPAWVRSVLDQCQESGTRFYFKQWGEYCAPNQMPEDTFRSWDRQHGTENCWTRDEWDRFRVGKKAAGRLLDGVLHDDLPWKLSTK